MFKHLIVLAALIFSVSSFAEEIYHCEYAYERGPSKNTVERKLDDDIKIDFDASSPRTLYKGDWLTLATSRPVDGHRTLQTPNGRFFFMLTKANGNGNHKVTVWEESSDDRTYYTRCKLL